MNEKAERINGCPLSNGVVVDLMGSYAVTGQLFQVSAMLVLSALLLGAFIIGSLSREDVDDDDFGGGMMIPATAPAP